MNLRGLKQDGRFELKLSYAAKQKSHTEINLFLE